jgi:proteasome lid subunit RPN8/RPN11
MTYSLSILKEQLKEIQSSFDNEAGHERAAYLFCSTSSTEKEKRLIVNEVQIVSAEDIKSSSPVHLSVMSRSFTKAMAKADREKKSLIWVHSHPGGYAEFSKQDDKEEKDFFRTAYIRAPDGLHGSMIVVGSQPKLIGRVWIDENTSLPIARIRVVGSRLVLFDYDDKNLSVKNPAWADRQVRAFGKEAQNSLAALHIGIVGAGGTGSAVAEQLIRLGIKKLTVIDDDILEETNVTRLYGSHLSDVGKPKVEVIRQLADTIGLGTQVHAVTGNITNEKTAKVLRDCDLIFCCTDDSTGRMILNRIAVWYFIPVIDMGIVIDSHGGIIREITGRVTILTPNNACLMCRGRITAKRISAETLRRVNPEEYRRNVNEGYAPELGERDPSVIMFTTDISSRAVMTFMNMLTGFMGSNWSATEIIERYHETDMSIRTGRNSQKGDPACFCMNRTKWGKGDQQMFLGRTW